MDAEHEKNSFTAIVGMAGAIAAALRSGGDKDVTVRELPGLNHLLQPATTGAPMEYGVIPQTISPAALALIDDWIARHDAR